MQPIETVVITVVLLRTWWCVLVSSMSNLYVGLMLIEAV